MSYWSRNRRASARKVLSDHFHVALRAHPELRDELRGAHAALEQFMSVAPNAREIANLFPVVVDMLAMEAT